MNYYPSLIKDLRGKLELSQERFAARIGVSLPTISRWETGKSKPEGATLHMLEGLVREVKKEHPALYRAFFGALPIAEAQPAEGAQPGRGRRKGDPFQRVLFGRIRGPQDQENAKCGNREAGRGGGSVHNPACPRG